MSDRPYHCGTVPRFGSFAGDLQVGLGVDLAVCRDASRIEAVRRSFRALALVGAWGGMAGESNQPSRSRLSLLDEGIEVSPGTLIWTFETAYVDPGVSLVVRNLVHGLDRSFGPVHALWLHQAAVRPGAPLSASLPLDFEPHPFETDCSLENSEVAVLVEFVDRPDPSRIEAFCEAWRAWETLAVLGAFADEIYRPGTASLAIRDDLSVTGAGLRVVYEDVTIADAGFYCLLNMIHVLHDRVAPVASVVLE